MNDHIIQELNFERETKGTVLYMAADPSKAGVRNVYITKASMATAFDAYPDKIKIVITDIS